MFKFPAEVDGWLSEREGVALGELAAGKDVLEIGAFCGRSTICLAQTAKSVITVDPFDGRGTPKRRNTFAEFEANLERYGLRDNVTAFCMITAEVPTHLVNGPSFDLAFIDGAHDVPSIEVDIRFALSVLKPDGLIAFHDYRLYRGEVPDGYWDPGVTYVVNTFLAKGAELLSRHDSLAVVRPPKRAE